MSEGRPSLSNTSSEAGALPLEVRIENDSVRILSKSKFVHCFLETTFLHVLCYPVIVSWKNIYGFSKSAPTPRYTILDLRLPRCNVISEGRLPLSNTGSEPELCPKRYVSRMTRSEYFLSQNSFIFFGNNFSPRFMLRCHCQPKIYLPFFEVCTYPSIHNFGLEASSL